MENKSYWAEIRNDYEPEVTLDSDIGQVKRMITIDAWKTGTDDEEGLAIAQIILTESEDLCIIYIDNVARTDDYAQEKIKEAIERIKK